MNRGIGVEGGGRLLGDKLGIVAHICNLNTAGFDG